MKKKHKPYKRKRLLRLSGFLKRKAENAGKRIYVVVAETVQHPLMHEWTGTHGILRPTDETKTIVQPKGRIAAQACHVVSRMRMSVLTDAGVTYACQRPARGKPWPELQEWYEEMKKKADEGITTIILSVPDSYQLAFMKFLMEKKGVKVHVFHDENPEYGYGHVMTAICTEPVEKSDLYGVTDYLPLWR